jgi:hypothetical protein
MSTVTLGQRDTSETGTNYEAIGSDAATECLDAILNSDDQASAYRTLLGLLNGLSGDGEIASAARRGAAMSLVNVIERGLGAISSNGGNQ